MALPSSKLVEKILSDKNELAKELSRIIESAANRAIEARGQFIIGVSGGSMAKFVCDELPNISTKWEAWKLILCDERLVSLDSPDNTLNLYLTGLLSTTPLKKEQFIAVNTSLPASEAASDYESKLRRLLSDTPSWPQFDMLLLGVGPDGHTASLFPAHKLLKEQGCWVAAITDSPKPPPCRVTLTLPVLNNARQCVMAFAGAEKAQMIKTLRKQHELPLSGEEEILPAARVRPHKGELLWLMDQAAAQ